MMAKCVCAWLVCLAATCGSLPAQTVLHGRGRFLIDVDYSRYFGDEKQVYVEIYYGIHENSITYNSTPSGFGGSVKMRLVVKSASAPAADKEWLVPHEIADSARMGSTQILTGLESVALPEGSYTLEMLAWDVNDPARKDSFSIEVPVAYFPADSEAMSDLELCTMIQSSSNKQSIFYKNTLEVTPNPARLFGVGIPIMYYYVELYNLLAAKGGGGATVVRTTVTNAAGAEVYSKDKPKPRSLNSSVEIGTVNLSAMKGGTYVVRTSLLDSAKERVLASTWKKFFVYRPGALPDTSLAPARDDLTGSEYAVMTAAEVDRELAYIMYLASDMERKQIVTLADLHSKQKFLFEFWKRRDPDPTTSQNEFKQEYMTRIEFADQSFLGGMRQGWKSDRGRVYVLYGKADEIERYPNTPESNPYEIWHYPNLQGGVDFVFVDKNAIGDYALVHSNHRDELHDPDWYRDYASKSK